MTYLQLAQYLATLPDKRARGCRIGIEMWTINLRRKVVKSIRRLWRMDKRLAGIACITGEIKYNNASLLLEKDGVRFTLHLVPMAQDNGVVFTPTELNTIQKVLHTNLPANFELGRGGINDKNIARLDAIALRERPREHMTGNKHARVKEIYAPDKHKPYIRPAYTCKDAEDIPRFMAGHRIRCLTGWWCHIYSVKRCRCQLEAALNRAARALA